MNKFIVDENNKNERLDKVLASFLPDLSRSYISLLIFIIPILELLLLFTADDSVTQWY